VWGRVVSEQVVRDTSVDSNALIADLGAKGVWKSQAKVLFDIFVIDIDTRSYLSHSPVAVLASAEAEKKQKYCDACTGIVPPLCLCASQWMVLWGMRLLTFRNI